LAFGGEFSNAGINMSLPVEVQFCDCIFEVTSRRLWRAGEIVALEPKMYELLEILIRKSPAVVSNEELDEILWPKVYVARTSLTRLVSELRSVLGDSPRDPRMIRTVYKTGYAFCATIVPTSTSTTPPKSLPAVVSVSWNGQRMPLSDGHHIAGRGAECSLIIDAETVSRRHARITVQPGAVTVEDLGSTNGVRVNGTRISGPTRLTDGSELALGSAKLRIRTLDPSTLTVQCDPSVVHQSRKG
jgi:DNA-binding winged helix-turn-helix (wHTH) protein